MGCRTLHIFLELGMMIRLLYPDNLSEALPKALNEKILRV